MVGLRTPAPRCAGAPPRLRGGPVRAGGRRDRRRHGAERATELQPGDRRRDRAADQLSVRDRAQQVRGAGFARRHGRRNGGAARARSGLDEDCQRHALAGLRPALQPGRTALAGE